MKAEDWMSARAYTCRPETSMNDAARLLWDNDLGCLPVVDARDQVVGLITDRDMCMCAYLRGKSLQDLSVDAAMSRNVFSCRPADSIEQVLRTMGENRVRRLPVVDGKGRLQGILSLSDLVRRLAGMEDGRQRRELLELLLETQAAIAGSADGQDLRQESAELESWRVRLDNLRVQASLGKMELRDKLVEFGGKLELAHHKARERLGELSRSSAEEARTLARGLQAGWDELRRAQRELAKKRAGRQGSRS